jgi:hypothetical protein
MSPAIVVPFFLFVVAPLIIFASVGWSQWLKHKRETGGLASAEVAREMAALLDDMHAALAEAEAQNEALTRRVENLEAIVTSASWADAAAVGDPDLLDPDLLADVGETAASPGGDGHAGRTTRLDLPRDTDAADASDLARRAKHLAQRLRS